MHRDVVSVYYTEKGEEARVVHTFEDGEYFIEYANSEGKVFFTENFPGKSQHYVQDAAENWTLGIKEIAY
jgi:hypothetical protein